VQQYDEDASMCRIVSKVETTSDSQFREETCSRYISAQVRFVLISILSQASSSLDWDENISADFGDRKKQ